MNSVDINRYIEDLLVGDKITFTAPWSMEYPAYLLELDTNWLLIPTTYLDKFGYINLCFGFKDDESHLLLNKFGYRFRGGVGIVRLHSSLSKLNADMIAAYQIAYRLGILNDLADELYATVPGLITIGNRSATTI